MTDKESTVIELVEIADRALASSDGQSFFEVTKELAERGDVASYGVLALLYETAQHAGGADLDSAYYWYSRSATEAQLSASYFAMARFHFEGLHAERNIAQAIVFFETAFRLGSLEAGVALAYCYVHSIGVKRDLMQALEFSSPAFKAGYIAAIALRAKIEFLRRHFIVAFKLYLKSIRDARALVHSDPESPKLFWLNISATTRPK